MWGSLELLQFLGGCKKVHKHCHWDVTIGRPCQTIHNLTKLQPFLAAILFSPTIIIALAHHHRDSDNNLDQWQLRSGLPNSHQFAKLARESSSSNGSDHRISPLSPILPAIIIVILGLLDFQQIFFFIKRPGYKDDTGPFHLLNKKNRLKGLKVFGFSI